VCPCPCREGTRLLQGAGDCPGRREAEAEAGTASRRLTTCPRRDRDKDLRECFGLNCINTSTLFKHHNA
jgi:hypothetical protein